MTTVTGVPPAITEGTTLDIRPRYEGANICTWIGFKHVNYLVEEAVYDHLRKAGLAPGLLYEEHGLCTDIVDLDTRILHALHVDDVVRAEVRPVAGDLRFAVTLHVRRGGDVKAVTAKARVQFRREPGSEPVPVHLAPFTFDRLGTPAGEPIRVGAGDVLAQLTGDGNSFGWKWRVPYFYCHFSEYVQMSGYLRLMEEVVDLFLAERGVSIKTLLDERSWIPVVPRSTITILDEARMEEELYTVMTVEEIFKNLTYTARVDTYVRRGATLVPTSTGRITHGYALIENRRDWSLVPFDERLVAALSGPVQGAAPMEGVR